MFSRQEACRGVECVALATTFFPLTHSVTCGEDELLTYESWKKTEQHIKYTWDVWKQRKHTSLPENPPKTSVSFKPAKHVMKRNSCHFFFYLSVFLMRIFIFWFVFSLTKWSTILPLFFGNCLSWLLESHRLEMSKCKTVIDLWDVMRSTPRCWFFLFFSLFFSKCSILSLLCNHIAKEWFQDLFHHYM